MWVRLDEWLVGDHFVQLVPTGSVMEEVGVCAIGQTLHPAPFDTDGIEPIPRKNPTRTGMAAYTLTGLAGPAQELLGRPRWGRGAMFLITVGAHPILTMLFSEEPATIPVGSRVTVECRFEILDGYDYGQLDDDFDPMAAWRVMDQRPTRRKDGFTGYLLDLAPEGSGT